VQESGFRFVKGGLKKCNLIGGTLGEEENQDKNYLEGCLAMDSDFHFIIRFGLLQQT
jgi:hypothetical protein